MVRFLGIFWVFQRWIMATISSGGQAVRVWENAFCIFQGLFQRIFAVVLPGAFGPFRWWRVCRSDPEDIYKTDAR